MGDPATLATAQPRPSPVQDDAKPRSHAVNAVGDELFGTSPPVNSILDHAPATMAHLPQQHFQGEPLPAQPVPELLQGSSPRSARSFSSSGHPGGSSGHLAVGSPARATSWGHYGSGNGSGTASGNGANGNGTSDGSGRHGGGNGANRSSSNGVTLPQLPRSPLRTPRKEEAVVQPSVAQPVLPTQALPVTGPVNITHNYTQAQAVMEAAAHETPEVCRWHQMLTLLA